MCCLKINHSNSQEVKRVKNLTHYYFQYKNLDTTAQHQYMADNYVIPIAKAIRYLDGNKYTLDYYMAFGWEGLTPYGYDGHFNADGDWVEFTSAEYKAYVDKMKIVLQNTT